MKHRYISSLIMLVLVFVIALIFSGCKGQIEIEKRGYVLAVGIDKVDSSILDKRSFQYMPLESEGPLYAFTIQIPVISQSLSKPGSQSGGNANQARDWNLTIISNTFFEANREYSTILDYPPYYSHLQCIIINSSVAEEDISKLLDMFLRDPEMRRRTKIFVTENRTTDILSVIPKIDNYAAEYLRGLPESSNKTSRLLHKVDLAEVSEAIHEHRDFALPRIYGSKYEIKDAGCAVFKDNKFVGWLDEIKTSYYKCITNTANGGIISVNLPECENMPVSLEIKKIKTKQRPKINGDSVEMELNINANLNIGEIGCIESLKDPSNIFDSVFLSQLEEAVEEKIKEQVQYTVQYVQKEYGADIFFFGSNIERFKPKEWDRLKENWDETFKNVKVTVNVKARVNQLGLIK